MTSVTKATRPRARPWLQHFAFVALAAGSVTAGGPAFAAQTGLAACRAANDDFDYERVVEACEAAAQIADMERADRIEVARLLGIAHTALNDETSAEKWFIKLLALDPTHDLGPAVSPVYRKMFERAKSSFAEQAKVTATFAAVVPSGGGGPWPLSAEIEDSLGRVSVVVVLARALRGQAEIGRLEFVLEKTQTLQNPSPNDPGPAGAEPQKAQQWTGSISDPAPAEIDGDYTLELAMTLRDAAGMPIALDSPLLAKTFPRQGAAETSAGGTGLWIGVGGAGAAAAAVVLFAGGSAAVLAGCVVSGICGGFGPSAPEPAAHVQVGPAL